MTMTTMKQRVQALDQNGVSVQVGDVVRFLLTDWLTWTATGHPQIEVVGQVTLVERQHGDRGPWFVVVDAPFVGPAPWRKPATMVEKVSG